MKEERDWVILAVATGMVIVIGGFILLVGFYVSSNVSVEDMQEVNPVFVVLSFILLSIPIMIALLLRRNTELVEGDKE